MIIPYLQFRSKSIIRYNTYVSEGRFFRTGRQNVSADKLHTWEIVYNDNQRIRIDARSPEVARAKLLIDHPGATITSISVVKNTYTGVLCPGARKRLTKSLEMLVQYAKEKTVVQENGHRIKFKINFITLTISNYGVQVTGKEAQKTLLEPFLKWMRDKYSYIHPETGKRTLLYLWKAELQAKREDCEQLHFHITTDVYIPWQQVRLKWNELQRSAGYLDSYNERYGDWNPNGTDVHALYKEKDPVMYMKKVILNSGDFIEKKIKAEAKEKYAEITGFESIDDLKLRRADILAEVTKDLQNRLTVGGKVWDCCLPLRGAGYYETIADGIVMDNLEGAIEVGMVERVTTDHCDIYKFRYGAAFEVLDCDTWHEYWEKGEELFNYERTPVKKPPGIIAETCVEVPRKVKFYVDTTLFSRS